VAAVVTVVTMGVVTVPVTGAVEVHPATRISAMQVRRRKRIFEDFKGICPLLSYPAFNQFVLKFVLFAKYRWSVRINRVTVCIWLKVNPAQKYTGASRPQQYRYLFVREFRYQPLDILYLHGEKIVTHEHLSGRIYMQHIQKGRVVKPVKPGDILLR
jgi:hypothetical protein